MYISGGVKLDRKSNHKRALKAFEYRKLGHRLFKTIKNQKFRKQNLGKIIPDKSELLEMIRRDSTYNRLELFNNDPKLYYKWVVCSYYAMMNKLNTQMIKEGIDPSNISNPIVDLIATKNNGFKGKLKFTHNCTSYLVKFRVNTSGDDISFVRAFGWKGATKKKIR